MTDEKPKRGRPAGKGRFSIQKHIFMDEDTAKKLAELAQENQLSESATIRQIIRRWHNGDAQD